MSDITRCTNCLSLVYDNAKTCHHCEEPLGKKQRRVFTRGTIAFILFSVTVFGVCDAVNILDDLSDHRRSAHRIFDEFARRALSGKGQNYEDLWVKDAQAVMAVALGDCNKVSTTEVEVSIPKFKSRDQRMVMRKLQHVRGLTETYTFSCRVWFDDRNGVKTSVLASGTIVFSSYNRFNCNIVDWKWHTAPNFKS